MAESKSKSETKSETVEQTIEEPGPSGYVEPRPEQKSGQGRDAGQEFVDARDELNEQERQRQEQAKK